MYIPQGDVIKVVPFEPVDCLPGYHLSSDGSTGTENCDQSSGPCADLVCVCDTVHISVLVHCESNRDELILKVSLSGKNLVCIAHQCSIQYKQYIIVTEILIIYS